MGSCLIVEIPLSFRDLCTLSMPCFLSIKTMALFLSAFITMISTVFSSFFSLSMTFFWCLCSGFCLCFSVILLMSVLAWNLYMFCHLGSKFLMALSVSMMILLMHFWD